MTAWWKERIEEVVDRVDEAAAAGAVRRHVADAQVPVQTQVHVDVPDGEDAAVAALPRTARAASLSQRRRALHRLQAVRSGLPGAGDHHRFGAARRRRSEEHTSELQSLMRISYAVFCLHTTHSVTS